MSSQILKNRKTSSGILKLSNFEKNIVNGSFSKIYIFIDGSYLKNKGKLYYRKCKKYGEPVVVITNNILDNIPEEDRRLSIADDINKDIIWIQQSNFELV